MIMRYPSDRSDILTHKHLLCNRTLKDLAKLVKWLNCVVSSDLYGAFDIWLHVVIMSRTSVRVNPHSIVCLNLEELLDRSRLLDRISLLSLKLQIWRLLLARSSLAFRQTIECRFTLKLVRDMIITCNQMHRTDQNSQHSSIIWPVWLNGWVFVYELSGCELESRYCHSNFRYCDCFYSLFIAKFDKKIL